MPQMMPLNWLTLFFYFMMIFFMINILNFFIVFYNSKPLQINQSKIKISWKW